MPVDTAEIAAGLAKARADRAPIEPFSAELADFDLVAAYEVQRLPRGDVLLSGGLTAAVPVTAGDVITVTADRLGSVELACQC
jgi:2-keto-4-pentenoate hydratase